MQRLYDYIDDFSEKNRIPLIPDPIKIGLLIGGPLIFLAVFWCVCCRKKKVKYEYHQAKKTW